MRARTLGLVLGAVLALGHDARAQDAQAFARQRFQQGVARFDAGQYASALEEFRASRALMSSPNTLLYVARCLARLDRLDEAVSAYEGAAGEATERSAREPRYLETQRAAQRELAALEPRIARLRVRVVGPASGVSVVVNDRAIPEAAVGLAYVMAPGRARVQVRATGWTPDAREVDLPAGRETEVLVRLAPARAASTPLIARAEPRRPAPPRPHTTPLPATQARAPSHTAAWVAFGVGAAGLASTAVFLPLALVRYRALEQRCDPLPCDATQNHAIAEGQTFQTVANVSMVLASVAVATGVVLWLTARPAATDRARASVLLGPGLVGGTF